MTLIANQTLAQIQAQQNLIANLGALDRTQPELRQWVADQMLSVEWVFARDRSLTAIDEFGQWWAGCSLPTRAARAVFSNKLEIKGAVGCFLAPTHAAQLRTALERLRPEQAIVAIIPEHRDLAMLLHCDDLSEAIQAHRLWMAAGPAWDVALRNLLERRSGLATPTQFIRTPEADPQQIQEMIGIAQQVFSEISTARSSQLQSISQRNITVAATEPHLCVVAPSRFRLWNDLGDAMMRIFDDAGAVDVSHFDADDPLCGSPLALVSAARQCSAIFTANTGRSDLPGLLPDSIPWITWVTGGRIPSSTLAGPDDRLMVVDPKLIPVASRSGWPAARVHLACWPNHGSVKGECAEKHLSIIADTCPLDTLKDLSEYSSHSILWESIRHELLSDPMTLADVSAFLRDRMRRAGVGEEAFSSSRFIDKLIVPAYQQGLARLLIRAKVPVRLYGHGWDAIPEYASHAAGEIQSREQVREAVAASTALVHVWPTNLSHPIEATGAPLIRRGPGGGDGFIQQAKRALNGRITAPDRPTAPFSACLILKILHSTSAFRTDTIQ